jgi:hypothetical protein
VTGQIKGIGGVDEDVVYRDEDAGPELDRLGGGVIRVDGGTAAADVRRAIKDCDIERDGGRVGEFAEMVCRRGSGGTGAYVL